MTWWPIDDIHGLPIDKSARSLPVEFTFTLCVKTVNPRNNGYPFYEFELAIGSLAK